ncbi:helix-turn-helix transcriptional regulator [Flammeovirga sp. EKP202]|uniref:ArsR/SmtB family transcription factor n=1 Tax=Flammeovirga sp. EKP202 TaxID=2770592 RepID=UPI00165F4752|nr:metalloregulator ArsR/SmtB family transcription factor [Flammeovirga sp. EKP202]MBD0400747.1 winged helix-turn-helix transcriptional regulator [Flammeovirga sp. EKP202]
MGITKVDGFTPEVTQMAEILKALGHPARLAIMEYLINSPDCINGDLVDHLPLAQSTVSRHLSELKKVGLIKGTITGNCISYCINDDVWDKIKVFFNTSSDQITPGKSCAC